MPPTRTPLGVLHDSLQDCRSCEFRVDDAPVPGWGDGSGGLAVVADGPRGDEPLLGRPFEERAGLVVKKLLLAAGLDPRRCLLTLAARCLVPAAAHRRVSSGPCRHWLREELAAAGVKAVVALGRDAVRALLDFPGETKLADVLGVVQTGPTFPGLPVFPWHSAAAIMGGGRALEAATVSLFKLAKESLPCSPPSAASPPAPWPARTTPSGEPSRSGTPR